MGVLPRLAICLIRFKLYLLQLLFLFFGLFIFSFPSSACGIEGYKDDSQVCALLESAKKNKPNVIVIVADDLGWADISAFGNPRSITPNLQFLAKNGVSFTDFYVSAPICSPSRAGFMTGISPLRLGITDTLHPSSPKGYDYNSVDKLDPKYDTITSMFHRNGYAVGHFGKWHLASDFQAPHLSEYGIDENFTYGPPDAAREITQSQATDDHHFGKVDNMLFEHAIRFIEKNQDRPFYINIWAHTPHVPLQPTDEQLERFYNAQGTLNVFKELSLSKADGVSSERVTAGATYFSAIMELDRQIGSLIESIRYYGVEKNTIIIFFSDNGPEKLTLPSVSNYVFGNTGPLRGRKFSIHEGGIRVPAIFYWPGVFAENLVDTESVISSLDIIGTLSAILGFDYDIKASDGENVTPALLGWKYHREKKLFWYYPKAYSVWGPVADSSLPFAIRDGDYKLILNPDNENVELYKVDFDSDPSELKEISSTNGELVRKLKEFSLALIRSFPIPDNKFTRNSELGNLHYFAPRQIGKVKINIAQ